MAPLFALRELFNTAQGVHARSSALTPLQWALGLSLTGVVTASRFNAPLWLTVLLAVLVGVIGVAFIAAYFVLLFRNPDALRSERFAISKMAIERGLVGDDSVGLLAAPAAEKKLPAGVSTEDKNG